MTDIQIWDTLVENQRQNAFFEASSLWDTGNINFTELPRFEDVNIPHWKLLPIIGKSDESDFWYRLSRGIFNVNMRLRSEENINYLEERDLFHDFFGHVPFLYNKDYTNYLIGLGNFYENSTKSDVIKRCLSNLYWFTSEFGLIKEQGKTKILGAGILSSVDETTYVLTHPELHKPFDIWEIVMKKDYVTNGFQDTYYVLKDISEFRKILKFLWRNL